MATPIRQRLRDKLLADPDVAALIGGRLYPASAPQVARRPFVTYKQFDSERTWSLERRNEYTRTEFELEVWSDAYNAGKDVARAVRLALENWREPPVEWVAIDTEQDDEQHLGDGRETPVYLVTLDAVVTHHEEVNDA